MCSPILCGAGGLSDLEHATFFDILGDPPSDKVVHGTTHTGISDTVVIFFPHHHVAWGRGAPWLRCMVVFLFWAGFQGLANCADCNQTSVTEPEREAFCWGYV